MKLKTTLLKRSSLLITGLLLLASLTARAATPSDVVVKPDQNPVPLRTVAPVAPNGQTGLVAVVCVVDEGGKVIDARVIRSTNPALEKAALTAIEAWTFRPAMKDGRPVKVKVTVPVRFEESTT